MAMVEMTTPMPSEGEKADMSASPFPPPEKDAFDAENGGGAAGGGAAADTPIGSGEASLPHPEELRGMRSDEGGRKSTRGRAWDGIIACIFLAALVALTVTLVFTVGVEVGETEPGPTTNGGNASPAASDAKSLENKRRFNEIVRFVNGRGISSMVGVGDVDSFDDMTSPQHQAAWWLAALDPDKKEIPPLEGTSFLTDSFTQRYALVVLYYSLGGPDWVANLRFLTGGSECGWYDKFRTNSGDRLLIGVGCNDQNVVTQIWTPWNNGLKGTLPKEIGLLQDLESLVFQFGNITGTIPDSIWRLSNLYELGLSNNFLTGDVPPSLATMTSLKILALDDNALTGKIFDKLTNLHDLTYLYLEDNIFHGDIHDMDVTHFPKLLHLDASSNLFSGTLSKYLFSHPTMTVLDLHDNRLTSEIPIDYVKQNTLNFLALHSNELTGNIPNEISRLEGLKYLDLSHNKFDGEIPYSIEFLEELEYLFLGFNGFASGPIPDFLRDMTTLKELSLKRTNRTGVIPHWIGELKEMYLLDLDDNSLTGTIPDSMGNMTGLFIALLNRNNINGTVPRSFANLTNLEVLLLDKNDLDDDVNFLCENRTGAQMIDWISADCGDRVGNSSEVRCELSCCNICCSDGGPPCNDLKYLINNDPVWEHSYSRYQFRFEN
mmetsp:Transcript_4396/g.9300  ORF Transcript_4396/g.9300 Transcript_4396/m.9300 type:complete len:661 (-) Transcript_4396:146-2128(-)